MNGKWLDKAFGGIVLIGIGVLFLLGQLDIIDVSIGYIFATFWPCILIYFGIQGLIKQNSLIWSLFMIALGAFYQGRNLDVISLSSGDFFRFMIPAALIIGGIYVIFSRSKTNDRNKGITIEYDHTPEPNPFTEEPPHMESTLDQQFEEKFGIPFGDQAERTANPESQYEQDRSRKNNQSKHHYDHSRGFSYSSSSEGKVNKSAFIGDFHLGRDYFELKPTNISQFIGDTVIDLTNAQIPYGETKINISAFIGDIKVYIPNDMGLGVKVNSNSFVGDMKVLNESRSGFLSNVSSVTTPSYGEAQKKVVINVSAFIGDIKVSSVG